MITVNKKSYLHIESMTTLAEKNRIYQQRYRAKVREQVGDDQFLEEKKLYMKKYRETRNQTEGYVKPDPVGRLAQPARRPPVQPKKEITLKAINDSKKKTQKQQNRIQLLKLNLRAKPLTENSIKDYIAKHVKMYKMFTGDEDSQTLGGWKQEVEKALRGQAYDDGLNDVLYYFKEIQAVIKALREKYTKDNSFKGYIGAITALLGRLDEFDTEYEYISNIGIVLQKEYTEVRDLNELTAEELAKINKIQFDDKSIADNVNKLESLRDQALYATYMYIPRRLEISTVVIRNNDKNTQTKGNYLILKNTVPDRFIFNDYKTSSSYHRQVVDVPEQIQPILHEYILTDDLGTDNFLFHLTRDKKEADSNFSKTFSSVFTKVYGENVTNQDLRTAYATYWNSKAKNKSDKNKVSQALSHSFETNEQYVKTNIKKE